MPALTEDDVDEDYIASAGAVVVSGTHFSKPNLDAMSKKAMRLARKHGGRVIFDIDYRPVLWGLTGHGLGEERFVASESVSAPPADHSAGLRRDRRHRGGDPHRRRLDRHARGLPAGSASWRRTR